ncbi:MAG TPA: trypsin-like peptidase domain-containing protein [Vicinamibacterales bacterium]|nr:trypsin-like peptidase domain-containing protein [Vicinamibacterales bacterium]
MICANCGVPLPEGAQFCPGCGRAVGARPARGRARNGLILAALAVVLAAIGAQRLLHSPPVVPTPPPPAPTRAAADLAIEEIVAGDPAAAARNMEQAAAAGDAQSTFVLARLYSTGFGVPLDAERARAMFAQAVERGAPQAALGLSHYLYTGTGGPPDRGQGLRVLTEAADANGLDPRGLATLGEWYWRGSAGVTDKPRGSALLDRAAAAGYTRADFVRGLAADEAGRPAEAFTLWLSAARAGDAGAAFELYRVYRDGIGTTQDRELALQWLQRSARQGHAGAQADVGYNFLVGTLVELSDVEGLRWSLRAAVGGNAVGLYNVGFVLQKAAAGGDRTSLSDAYTFFNLAAAKGHASAVTARDEVEAQLQPAEILSAQELARDFSAGTSTLQQVAVSGTGTGFWVDLGRLVTNEHVIGGCARVAVRTDQGTLEDVTVVAADAESDLAVLQVLPKPGATHVSALAMFAAEEPPLGEQVVAFGYPLSGVLASAGTLGTGTVSANRGLLDDPDRLQFSAPVQPGNSGGAILNELGHVIGVVQAVLNPITQGDSVVLPQNVNFGIKARRLRELLVANGITPHTGSGGRRLDSKELAVRAQRVSAQVVCYQSALERVLGR